MSLSLEGFITIMNGWPPEAVWVLMAMTCFSTILIMLRLFGASGIYVYMAVAIVIANIQVTKAVQFNVYPNPVALGTVVFASTYLCTDILTEYYGRVFARRGLWIGFCALSLSTILMTLTLGFAPMTAEQAASGDMAWALPNHDAMMALFKPAPALLVAGMAAYITSQYNDIWIYLLVRRLTGTRHLWLRNNVSTMVSAFIDNTIFSVLAWVVFAPTPVGLSALFFTFILGTYFERMFLAVADTPFMYLARWCLPMGDRARYETELAAARAEERRFVRR